MLICMFMRGLLISFSSSCSKGILTSSIFWQAMLEYQPRESNQLNTSPWHMVWCEIDVEKGGCLAARGASII